MSLFFVRLAERGVLRIGGADAPDFLQGLISNDIVHVTPERTLLAALLSPQGKFQFDFFVGRQGEEFLLEMQAERIPALARMLGMYKLRRAVTITPWPDAAVFATLGESGLETFGLNGEGATQHPGEPVVSLYADPRDAALGARVIASHAGEGDAWLVERGFALEHPERYERLRLEHGVPDGFKDAVIDRTILLENGYERFHGIDFTKGCYVGQEVTARSKHKAELRKKLCRVFADGELPPAGTPITAGAQEVGEMRSSAKDVGLALIRLDRLALAENAGETPVAGGLPLTIRPPEW